jgi:hypothetical protein
MSQYLLTCSCGRTSTVTARQAGQSIRCACGAALDVPTLRGLRDLPPAVADGASKPTRTWDNRHRAVFAMLLGSAFALTLGVYFAGKIQQQVLPPAPRTLDANSTPSDVLDAFVELRQGFKPDPIIVGATDERELWLIGKRVSLSLGGVLLAGAVLVLLTGRARASQVQREPSNAMKA